MREISIITVAVLAIFGIIMSKRKLNMQIIFCSIWCIILICAKYQIYNMTYVKDQVYLVVLLGCIGFSLGYFLSSRYTFKIKRYSNKILENNNYTLRKGISYIVLILAIFIQTIILLEMIKMLKGGSLSELRTLFNKGDYGALYGGWLSYANSFLVTPVVFISVPLFIENIFSKKSDYKIFVLTILLIIMHVISSAGRFVLLYFVVDMVYMLYIKRISIPKKILKKILGVTFIAIVIIIVITNARIAISFGNGIKGIIKSLAQYFTLNMPLLDYWMDYANEYHILTYGNASLKGIVEIFNIVGEFLNIPKTEKYIEAYTTLSLIESTYLRVFPDRGYNAFVTMFYSFYLDFRLYGVILLSGIYGFISGAALKGVFKKPSFSRIMFFLLFLQSFTKMFVRFEFQLRAYIIAFLWLFLLIKKDSLSKSINSVNIKLKDN